MQSKIILAAALATTLGVAGCSGTPDTAVSPSGISPTLVSLNPDGSNLKVDAPTNLQPTDDVEVDSNRPTLTWTAAAARHVQVALDHELQIVDANDSIVYSRFPLSETEHTVEVSLDYSDNFWWRVRARIGEDVGPWSEFAPFRTPDPPGPPPPPPGGGLPFPVPAECGPFGPSNRLGCVLAVAALSEEWGRCRSGSGLGCHRFVRQVFHSLNLSDDRWSMIIAQPGGHACHCGGCGGSDGTMFREDTMHYPGFGVVDIVTGAGGPSPGLSYSRTSGPRSGDTPADAPLCEP